MPLGKAKSSSSGRPRNEPTELPGAGGESSDRYTFELYSKDMDLLRSVTLYVNPSQLQITHPRIFQKIQTLSPRRFVIQDWGTDLPVFEISGVTGRLLPSMEGLYARKEEKKLLTGSTPSESTSSGSEKKKSFSSKIKNKFLEERARLHPKPMSLGEAVASLGYHQVISMTEAYLVFFSLYSLYREYKASLHELFLKGESIWCRGFFSNFSITQDAESPWCWRYSTSFVILEDNSSLYSESGLDYTLDHVTVYVHISTEGSSGQRNE